MWSRLKRTFRDDSRTQEIQEEIDFHLEMETRGGRDTRSARLRLGNPTRIQEETRAAGIYGWLESILQDIRYAMRQFRKAPGLSLAVVASLTIGLGANIAIFGLIEAAVLRPLPVADPDGLVQLEWRNTRIPANANMNCGSMSGARNIQASDSAKGGGRVQLPCISQQVFRAFAARQSGFVGIIGTGRPAEVAISATAEKPAEQVRFLYVSANFFDELGVRLAAGRPFTTEEDRPQAEPVIVVSHRFWSSRLGGDPGAIGRSVRINDKPARIVGVAPPGFFGLIPGEWIDVFRPLGSEPASQVPGFGASFWGVDIVARLAPGASAAAAAEAMTPLFRNLVAETTGTKIEEGLDLIARPAARGLYSGDDAEVSRALWILMLLVGVLLLIVCANVANLLLSRSVKRRPESALRLALGAGRGRLVRQHLVESGMLAVIGGASGLFLGSILARWIHALFQTGQGPGKAFAVTLDWRVSAYALAISTLTALIFGLAPAWTAARSQVSDALKIQSRSVLGGGLRLPKLLVSVQFALSFAALVAAGLLGRSLGNLYSTDLGFDGELVSFATVRAGQAGVPAAGMSAYQARLIEEITAIPGVVAVATMLTRPLDGGPSSQSIEAPGGPPTHLVEGVVNPAASATLSAGGPGFIEVLGLRLLAGRTLEAGEGCALFRSVVRSGGEPAAADPSCSVVVDQRFAEVFFRGQNPVGQVFRAVGQPRQIVGLVANARHGSLRGEAPPTMYLQLDAPSSSLTAHLAIRAKIDSGALAAAVRQAVVRIDSSVPLAEFHTQSELVDRLLRTERLLGLVSGAFSIAALALAAVGLGGLLSYVIARRTNEIGIRMALGATRAQVRRMVLGDSIGMVGAGVLVGIPAAWAVGRYLESQLVGLEPVDLSTALLALLALIVIAGMASVLPARRAARVSPLTALREE
jgi:predicted permease